MGCVTDIFSGISSAPDNLSDQRLSMVCVVTMLLMNFGWVHSPGVIYGRLMYGAVIWCGQSTHYLTAGSNFQGVGSLFPSIRLPPFPPQHPRSTLQNHCPIQILPEDDRSAGWVWGNISPGPAVTEPAAWQGLGWLQEELREGGQLTRKMRT